MESNGEKLYIKIFGIIGEKLRIFDGKIVGNVKASSHIEKLADEHAIGFAQWLFGGRPKDSVYNYQELLNDYKNNSGKTPDEIKNEAIAVYQEIKRQ